MQIKMLISIRPYLQNYLIEKLHKKFGINCLQQMINSKHSHVKSFQAKASQQVSNNTSGEKRCAIIIKLKGFIVQHWKKTMELGLGFFSFDV